MIRYTVDVYLNRSARALLAGYRQGDPVEMVLRLAVRAESIVAAADDVFALSNDPARYNEGKRWGWGNHRSLSVGDVLIVRWMDAARDVHERSLTCAHSGWTRLGAPWPSQQAVRELVGAGS